MPNTKTRDDIACRGGSSRTCGVIKLFHVLQHLPSSTCDPSEIVFHMTVPADEVSGSLQTTWIERTREVSYKLWHG